MKIEREPNKLVVTTRRGKVLWSYDTAVAVWEPSIGWTVTKKFWSKTTSQHIAQHVGGEWRFFATATQRQLEKLVQEI